MLRRLLQEQHKKALLVGGDTRPIKDGLKALGGTKLAPFFRYMLFLASEGVRGRKLEQGARRMVLSNGKESTRVDVSDVKESRIQGLDRKP